MKYLKPQFYHQQNLTGENLKTHVPFLSSYILWRQHAEQINDIIDIFSVSNMALKQLKIVKSNVIAFQIQ